jgi:hypothetical protein
MEIGTRIFSGGAEVRALCRQGEDEVKEAERLAVPEALTLRRFLDVYFYSAERVAAQAGDGVQLGASAALRKYLAGNSRAPFALSVADYAPMVMFAAHPERLAHALLDAMTKARPHELLHIREDRQGWKATVGSSNICAIHPAPRMGGSPFTEVIRGEAAAGAFDADAKVRLLPVQALLFEAYRRMEAPVPPAGSSWEDVFHEEAMLYKALRGRLAGAGITGGAESGGAARVLVAAAAEGLPLLGRHAAAKLLGQPPPRGRAYLASDSAKAAAARIARQVGGTARSISPQVPGFPHLELWHIRVGDSVVGEISNAPEHAPLRTFSGGGAVWGGYAATLASLALELWTLENLSQREIIPNGVSASKQASILRLVEELRAALRRNVAKEWLGSQLYGFLPPPVRANKKATKMDPQF